LPYRAPPPAAPKIPDGPDHIGAAQRIARRNRRIGLVLVAALAAALGISMMLRRADVAQHRAALDAARLELEACLLGPEPLAGDARGPAACGVRVRRRQLTAMATPVEKRIDDALQGWPMRCNASAKHMMREAVTLEDGVAQQEATHLTYQLGTMTALSKPLDIALCVDASGRARPPHLSSASHDASQAWAPLSAPLDLDALVAHGSPSHPATTAKMLERDERLIELLPDGYREVGSIATRAEDASPNLPDGESMMTDRDWAGVIHFASCHGGKCKKRIVSRETFDLNDPELRASEPERFHPARIGDSIVAVWRGGTRSGLRMRVAPIDRLAATHDVVVFDDLLRDGAIQGTSTLEAFRVYGGAHEARIFLVTARGTWIVTVDDKGAFSLR
jgi:hypothetical protein